MTNKTTAMLRGLFMATVITAAGVASMLGASKPAQALPRDPIAGMINECYAFGGVFEDWSYQDPFGRLIGWYTCTYDFGWEECWDFPGEENFCNFVPDPDLEPDPVDEPDPDPWVPLYDVSWSDYNTPTSPATLDRVVYGDYASSSTSTMYTLR